MEQIVFESNRYAMLKGHNFRMTLCDLQTYLGMNIIMTYIKYPRSRMYWSSIVGLGLSMISDAMPVNKFENIKRFLHFVNNDDENTLKAGDKFWKIRPVAKYLHETFHTSVVPEERQSIDEMIVPFKGKSSLKMYMKQKPKKWGFKLWIRASSTGYISCFELYQGKIEGRPQRSKFGPIGDTVVRLCHDIHSKNYKVYMDNLFTSLNVIEYLQDKQIFVVGTVRTNRINEATKHLVDAKTLPHRGSCSIVTSSDNITVVRWMDNKAVHTISTYAGAEPESDVRRYDRSKKQYVTLNRPYSITEYNAYMGGVDLMDRMIAHYPHGFKNKRWYLRVFFQLLNISIINAWLLYKQKKENIPLLEFKAHLANSLIALGTLDTRRRRGRPSSQEEAGPPQKRSRPVVRAAASVRYDGVRHYPKKVDCANPPRCHDVLCRKRTRYICEKCTEPVCPDCMKIFHTPT